MLLSDFILLARSFAGDGPTDNLARLESLNNPDIAGSGIGIINGTNVYFVTANFPIASIIIVLQDGVPTDNYTNNPNTGFLKFETAPAESAYTSYYYYLMTDAAWTNFTQDALSRIDITTNTPATDIQNVPSGLTSALTSYACGSWARRIAGQSGLWYNQRLQERQEERDSISKKYLTMSEAFLKDGDIARDDYYKGAGQQFRPAYAIVQHTPRQYTPQR